MEGARSEQGRAPSNPTKPDVVRVRSSTHRRAADAIPKGLHDAGRHQGRAASLRKLRDGLRPPMTPATAEQLGGLSGRWLSLVC